MAQDDIARLWLEIGRQRADGVALEHIAQLPRFCAARAARKADARARPLLNASPDALLKEIVAGASASDALILYGDSWFKYPGCPTRPYSNMSRELRERGFTVYDAAAYPGAHVIDLAQSGNLDQLTFEFRQAAAALVKPKAVVLCGGGNDAVGDGRFYDLLNDPDSGKRGLNEAALRQRVDVEIQNAYLSILGSIDGLSRTFFGGPMRTLVHGYDYPVPDSRGACVIYGPWLGPQLEKRGYSDPSECRRIARDLIDRLNAMQAGLAERSGLEVTHVRLTGTLSTDEAQYKRDWENELHPTKAGFGRVTDALVQQAGL